ncbi:hypothetical protein ROLI_040380 [Roseobacter fucihabitans]|uniref:Uncharacterized protein n=1 Tax=Roseobacter fucihabitans TaxID=1537242 RepID=A0ABZ2C0S3_9RHOB|nr:hypothetical protein [Roseobacter litoralis]
MTSGVYPERLVIVAQGQTVCTHERIIDRSHRKPGKVIYDWRHLHHDESAVLRAVELALEAGVPTKTHILNPLHRLIDPKQTDHPEIDPPPSRQIALQSPVGQWMLLHWKPPQRQMWIAMTTSDRQEASAMRHDPAGASIIIMLRSLKLRLAKGEHL